MTFPSTLPRLLQELVARPSVMPGADTGGTVAGETALAAYVAGLLHHLGAEVATTEVSPGRPNVVAWFRSPRPSAPVVALVPHLDTVGVGGMTIAPFSPEIRQGRLYGRGASDTKGPMAAALWALRRWLRQPSAKRAGASLVFAATMGEEGLGLGATALCEQGFRADFAIALEPTDLKVVHAAKGVLRLWVEAAGCAAHSSAPHRGRNAILAALPFLTDCERRITAAFTRARHPQLGSASLNVATIEGGTAFNIVPDRCRVALDMRTHPAFDNQAALAVVTAAAESTTAHVTVHRSGPPFALSRQAPWVRALAPHARGFAVAPWFSDANVFNAHGTPAVAFGPGSIKQAHTAGEFIELSALEEGARAFEAFLQTIARGSPSRA